MAYDLAQLLPTGQKVVHGLRFPVARADVVHLGVCDINGGVRLPLAGDCKRRAGIALVRVWSTNAAAERRVGIARSIPSCVGIPRQAFREFDVDKRQVIRELNEQ